MTLKNFKPYTKSTRGTVLVSKDGLWKGKPFKSLTVKKSKSHGRNNYGRITSRHIGGGHKQMYRVIDFFRKKDDVPGTVKRIEYKKNRTSYIMLVEYKDGHNAQSKDTKNEKEDNISDMGRTKRNKTEK